MDWKRARTENQVEQRIDGILAAAGRLFERYGIDDITLAMIARESAFTRSNLYRYFGAREDIFLELLARDLQVWLSGLGYAFRRLPASAIEFAGWWVDCLLEHDRMLRLLGILHTTLEQCSSPDAVASFRKRHREIMKRAVSFLDGLLLFTGPEDAADFLEAQIPLAAGMYNLISMTDRRRKAYERAGIPNDTKRCRSILVESTASIAEGCSAG